MRTKLHSTVAFGLFFSLFLSFFAPLAGQAAVVKTVKKDASASKCVTPVMKGLYQKAVTQMKTDVAKLGEDHPAAVSTYKKNLEIVWSAMEEPYCGHGSQGIAAVKKSFIKSVDRLRAGFLAQVKPQIVAIKK